MHQQKISASTVFFIGFLASSLVIAQENQVVSESRISIMAASNPYAFMLAQLKKSAVPAAELYSCEDTLGIFFIVPGTDHEKPNTAFIVPAPRSERDSWPQAVWLSCLKIRASTPRETSTLFVLLPPDADLPLVCGELSQFETISAIVVLENSEKNNGFLLKSASGEGQCPRSLLSGLHSIFKSAGLRWSETPVSAFFLRFGFSGDTGLLSRFHEQGLPAVSLSSSFGASDESTSEAGLPAALAGLEITGDAPGQLERNYLDLSFLSFHLAISEKLIIITSIFGLLLLIFLGFTPGYFRRMDAAPGDAVNVRVRKVPAPVNALALLIVLFAISLLFFTVSSNPAFYEFMAKNHESGFFAVFIIFSLLVFSAFAFYFSVLKFARLNYAAGTTVFLLFFCSFLLSIIFYFPISIFLLACAVIFLFAHRNPWLSTIGFLLLTAPIAISAFLNIGASTRPFPPGSAAELLSRGAISSLLLSPFFSWLSILANNWLSRTATKILLIATAIMLVAFSIFIMIFFYGNLA